MATIKHFLTPQYWLPKRELYRDDLSDHDYLISIKISLATIVGIIAYLTIYWLIHFSVNIYFITLPLLALLATTALFVIKFTGNKILAGHLFIIGDILYLYLAFIIGNGIHSGILIWISIFPFIAILLTNDTLGQRWSSFFMGLIISSAIIIFYNGVDFDFYHGNALLIQVISGLIILPYALIYIVKSSYVEVSKLLFENMLLSGEITNILSVIVHDTSHLTTKLAFLSRLSPLREYSNKELIKKFKQIKEIVIIIDELINQVREMTAYSTNKKQLKFEKILADDIIQEINFCFHERLAEKNLVLKSHKSDQKLALWSNKRILINNVLNNLISNAIKFSPAGASIFLEFQHIDNKIVIIVADEGIGIDQEKLKHIFSFTQETSTQGTVGELGTGLGLPIVKKTLSLIHGSLHVTSTQEHGTAFYITLPNHQNTQQENL